MKIWDGKRYVNWDGREVTLGGGDKSRRLTPVLQCPDGIPDHLRPPTKTLAELNAARETVLRLQKKTKNRKRG